MGDAAMDNFVETETTENTDAVETPAASTDNRPVFKVQFMVSSAKLNSNDKAFKGLTPVEFYHDKGLYKYTYSATTDYNKILQAKKKVNEKFKDAFIVAFINGERVDTQKAIALYNESNP
jgi:N-acetylmuramoyl-L-alanine amidase